MSVGACADKKRRPSEAEVEQAIGTGLALWRALVAHLRAREKRLG